MDNYLHVFNANLYFKVDTKKITLRCPEAQKQTVKSNKRKLSNWKYYSNVSAWLIRIHFLLLHCNVVSRWEKDLTYCDTVKQTPPYNHGTRLVDLIDMAVLDFLMSQSLHFCQILNLSHPFIYIYSDKKMTHTSQKVLALLQQIVSADSLDMVRTAPTQKCLLRCFWFWLYKEDFTLTTSSISAISFL